MVELLHQNKNVFLAKTISSRKIKHQSRCITKNKNETRHNIGVSPCEDDYNQYANTLESAQEEEHLSTSDLSRNDSNTSNTTLTENNFLSFLVHVKKKQNLLPSYHVEIHLITKSKSFLLQTQTFSKIC